MSTPPTRATSGVHATTATTTTRNAPCALCQGLGFTIADAPVGHPMFGKPVRCACKAEEDQRRAYERATRASDLRPAMVARMTFENFDARRNALVSQAARSLYHWAAKPTGWRVLIGPPGCGKTHLAVATVGRALACGHAAVYVVAPDVLARLREAMFDRSANAVKLDHLREAPALVLDDFGAQQDTDWADEQFFRVLDYRYRAELPTLIASNVSVYEWPAYRIASRAADTRLSRVFDLDDTSDYRVGNH